MVCREPEPRHELVTLARRYLYFLAQAQAPDGRFRNRLGYDRRWRDLPGTHDCWGRALWGLGTAAARGPAAAIREESLARFDLARRSARAAARHGVRCARRRRGADISPGRPAALGSTWPPSASSACHPSAAWLGLRRGLSYANAATRRRSSGLLGS